MCLGILRRFCKENKVHTIFIIIFYSGSIFQEGLKVCGKFCICYKIGNYRKKYKKRLSAAVSGRLSAGADVKNNGYVTEVLQARYKDSGFQRLIVGKDTLSDVILSNLTSHCNSL